MLVADGCARPLYVCMASQVPWSYRDGKLTFSFRGHRGWRTEMGWG